MPRCQSQRRHGAVLATILLLQGLAVVLTLSSVPLHSAGRGAAPSAHDNAGLRPSPTALSSSSLFPRRTVARPGTHDALLREVGMNYRRKNGWKINTGAYNAPLRRFAGRAMAALSLAQLGFAPQPALAWKSAPPPVVTEPPAKTLNGDGVKKFVVTSVAVLAGAAAAKKVRFQTGEDEEDEAGRSGDDLSALVNKERFNEIVSEGVVEKTVGIPDMPLIKDIDDKIERLRQQGIAANFDAEEKAKVADEARTRRLEAYEKVAEEEIASLKVAEERTRLSKGADEKNRLERIAIAEKDEKARLERIAIAEKDEKARLQRIAIEKSEDLKRVYLEREEATRKKNELQAEQNIKEAARKEAVRKEFELRAKQRAEQEQEVELRAKQLAERKEEEEAERRAKIKQKSQTEEKMRAMEKIEHARKEVELRAKQLAELKEKEEAERKLPEIKQNSLSQEQTMTMEQIERARKQPKSLAEEQQLIEKYGAMGLEERAFNIVVDLGMVEINPDPENRSGD